MLQTISVYLVAENRDIQLLSFPWFVIVVGHNFFFAQKIYIYKNIYIYIYTHIHTHTHTHRNLNELKKKKKGTFF
jgi:hypothetical protein